MDSSVANHNPPAYSLNCALSQQGQQSPAQASTQKIQPRMKAGPKVIANAGYPECSEGIHEPRIIYGIGGIMCSIFCFPIGIICCLADKDEVCRRCGVKLSEL